MVTMPLAGIAAIWGKRENDVLRKRPSRCWSFHPLGLTLNEAWERIFPAGLALFLSADAQLR